MKTLAETGGGRDNNFNLIRMICALGVLVSHSYPLALGKYAIEPLQDYGIKLGTLCLYVFFVISGFFVTKSFVERGSVIDFVRARVLRIYPGLIVALIFGALIIGPAFTTWNLKGYFEDHETAEYLYLGVSLKWLTYYLPGVFENNPYKGAVNGSLWSLYFEAYCYFLVVAVGAIGLLRPRLFVALLPAYFLWYFSNRQSIWQPGLLGLYAEFTLPFVFGACAYLYRRYVPMHYAILVGLLAVLLVGNLGDYQREVIVLTAGYGTLLLGFAKFEYLKLYNRVGDYSYGTYIYAFIIQQSFASLIPGITPLKLMLLSVLPTLLLAAISWHLIEKPALSLKGRARETTAPSN